MPSFAVVVDGLSTSPVGRRLVEGALTAEAGIIRLHVSRPLEVVRVTYDPARTGPQRLVAALQDLGLQIRDPLRQAPTDTARTAQGPAAAGPAEPADVARAAGAGLPVDGTGRAEAVHRAIERGLARFAERRRHLRDGFSSGRQVGPRR